jgi:methyl-accepting chemotaxis protein
VTQQNAALVEEASAAAQALSEQASNLTQLISRYRLGENRSEDAPSAAPVAPAIERRSALRPLTGKRRLATVAIAAPLPRRAASAAGAEDWKDF